MTCKSCFYWLGYKGLRNRFGIMERFHSCYLISYCKSTCKAYTTDTPAPFLPEKARHLNELSELRRRNAFPGCA